MSAALNFSRKISVYFQPFLQVADGYIFSAMNRKLQATSTSREGLVALGVCHCGPGSEAGGNGCYIKFGAARSGSSFDAWLEACETFGCR